MKREAGAIIDAGGSGRAFIAGLAPLGSTAIIVLVTIGLAELVRRLTGGQGFATQQAAALAVVATGAFVGGAALLVSAVRALRRVKGWEQSGRAGRAAAALWGLAVVALVVALPLLLAIAIPQQPAPVLAP